MTTPEFSVVAVSTALNPPPAVRAKCENSISSQTFPIRHIYIDAGQQGGACLENVFQAVHSLHPTDIVLWVDGDDWLIPSNAAEIVIKAHRQGAWVTWGQYLLHDGKNTRVGHCHDSLNRRMCRREPWYASHLRTFRAGLFQQIKQEDLFWKGTWSPECCDLATMFPMLEMADGRAAFISDTLYGYNYTDRRARKHDIAGPLCDAQREYQTFLRNQPPYPRLERTPW